MTLWVQIAVGAISLGSIYALVALGFNVIFKATGGVSFAHGEYVTLGGFLAVALYQFGLPIYVAAPIAIALSAAVCVGLYDLTIRMRTRVTGKELTLPVLAMITLGHLLLIENIQREIWGADLVGGIPFVRGMSFAFLGAFVDAQVVFAMIGGLSLFAALSVFFDRTASGQKIMAVSIDSVAASSIGIDVEAARRLSFALAGATGALAGVLVSPIASLFYNQGLVYALQGLGAAILGGLGSIRGALVGGLAFGAIQSVSSVYAPAGISTMVPFMALLLALIVFPHGLRRAASTRTG